MSNDSSIMNALSNYSKLQINKIQDFLLSEIDIDTLQETLDFIECTDIEKKEKYHELIYDGDKYESLFLEGNQYLIGNYNDKILIIDIIGEEKGLSKELSNIFISKSDFRYLISHKKEVLNWIRNRNNS